MILADTSVWIEFLRGKEPIHSRFKDFLKLGKIFSLPWIFGELLQGALDDEESQRLLSFWEVIPKPESEELEKIWLDAGVLSRKSKFPSKGVGLIDAAIIQSARLMNNSVVWTLDKKLQKVTPSGQRFSLPQKN